jgi:hypothetical protein
MGGDGVLPLRPLTLGELLDAGVALLRRHAGPLLLSGAVLAAVEQAALYPLRRRALVGLDYWAIDADHLGAFWLLIAVGLGTEAVIITLLGGLAAPAAQASLVGVSPGRLYRHARPSRLVPLALVVGLGATVSAAAGLLPWLGWYMLTGLAAPALVIDRRVAPQLAGAATRFTAVPLPSRPIGVFPALGRSISLVFRGRLRPGGIRLLGYLAWYTIRVALGLGGVAALGLVVQTRSSGWSALLTMIVWVAVNGVAYPALACLDAVLHLENRMRVEGLDIALSRALRRGTPAASVLAVPR